jgi:hypothetical protein
MPSCADPVQQQRQAQATAEADIGGTVAGGNLSRIDCGGHDTAVAPVEADGH